MPGQHSGAQAESPLDLDGASRVACERNLSRRAVHVIDMQSLGHHRLGGALKSNLFRLLFF